MEIDFESLVEATSGALGYIVSTTILYPLDTCKSKYQAEVRVAGAHRYRGLSDVLWEAISNRQFLSLYQGLGTKNLQSFVAQFIYFYGYSCFKRLYLSKRHAKSIGTKANLFVGAAAGACTSMITQPLDTASSRMQTSVFGESKGLWETLSQGSWSKAFDGLGISLLLTSNPTIQYTVFDQLKERLLRQQRGNKTDSRESATSPLVLSALSAFLLGALSKSIATFFTYPLIRCKVMIQASEPKEQTQQGAKAKAKSKTIADTLYIIWKKEGPLGFYKGLEAQILKTVLSSALLLMIKENISKSTWVLMLSLRNYLLVVRKRVKNN